MKLEVQYNTENQLPGFDVWLLKRIKRALRSLVNPKKIQFVSEYLQKEDSIPKLSDNVDALRIFLAGVDSLYVVTLEDKFIIQLNKNQFAPGLDRVKLSSIIKLITYGNKVVPPYPLFITVFRDVEKNIQHYVEIFQEEET